MRRVENNLIDNVKIKYLQMMDEICGSKIKSKNKPTLTTSRKFTALNNNGFT